MPIPAFRAKQSTDTSGTGTLVLNAAATNARSFNAAFGASARRIMYCISWATGFEIGYGDFNGGTPGSLTRATVLASSNAGSLVTLPGGTADVFAVFEPAAREVVSISTTATLALADLGNAVIFTGASAATLNLPAVATVPNGAGWLVMNRGTAALTIDPNGAEQVNGATTLVLQAGQAAMILRASGAWQAALLGGTSIGLSLLGALDAAAARTAIGAPASPSLLGFQHIATTTGGTWTLPAGGTWAYSVRGFTAATGETNFQFVSGTAAGGAAIISSPGVIFEGFAWRIA